MHWGYVTIIHMVSLIKKIHNQFGKPSVVNENTTISMNVL